MQEIPHFLGFTAGELTPWLDSRYDLQAYRRGAARLENFIVQPYGGVQRRRGSAWVSMAASQEADAVKLFAFVYSAQDALMLEFFPGGMRVYRDGCLLMAEPASPGEAAKPYVLPVPWKTAEQVLSLRFTQVNDAVYVTCPTYSPVVLYRTRDTDWRCEEPVFEPFPRISYTTRKDTLTVELESNGRNTRLVLPEDAESTLTADMEGKEYVLADAEVAERTYFRNTSFSPFLQEMPDLSKKSCFAYSAYYKYDATVRTYRFWTCIRAYTPDLYCGSDNPADYPAHFMAGAVWKNERYEPYEVCGEWELYTTGTWTAQLELWRSYDEVAYNYIIDTSEIAEAKALLTGDYLLNQWTCIKSFGQSDYTERKNWALSGSESRPCRMLIVVKEASGTSLTPFLHFRTLRGKREYKFRILKVEDAHHARAVCLTRYCDSPRRFATTQWSYGAFGPTNGYPAFSSYSAGRLWFGGMRQSPTNLLGSVVDDFHNFRMDSQDDSALHLTIASDNQSRICWLAPTRQLLVGTSDGVWLLGSSDGGLVTPTTAAFRRQTSVGCENLPPLAVESSILFPQRGGKRLREISYKLESDGFSASDLSLMAEHLLGSGIREYAVQEGIGSYVWTVLHDGSVAVLTLHPEQQVSAWQRVSFPGRRVLHVASLPRAGSELDELWLVLRSENGGLVSIERLNSETAFMDAAVCVTTDENGRAVHPAAGTAAALLLVPEQGASLCVVPGEDGSFQAAPQTSYTAGIPYFSVLHTMPMESEISYNSVREFSRVRLRLLESSPAFEYKGSTAERWECSEPERLHLPSPYTGSLRLAQMPQAAVGQGFCLRCGGTEDFRLLGLTIEVDHHGK